MELTELERAWQGLDQRLAGLEHELQATRRHRTLDTVRRRLRWLGFWQAVQLAVGAAIVLWAGPYWIGHWGQWHLVGYGLGIHVYGLALLITAVVQLLSVAWVDYRKPVAEVQQRLLMLRRVRVWGERWGVVLGFAVWMPVLFALLAAMGMDLWTTRPGVVLANAGLAGVLAATAWGVTQRHRERFARDASGRSLLAAEAELSELRDATPRG
ncbi:hypothetical protein [Arenimonas sp. MALMAid1274]|uniref:hypothetical protein n=1 Tax=Arenimonas sp. MALMAid1274 TaxID=3411630 RepID=UPI003BA03F82